MSCLLKPLAPPGLSPEAAYSFSNECTTDHREPGGNG
jgi:hypothetical protein